ncbi:MarR family winged helix-turn-helix transcriptional regulator, partial [Profundibacter sp.]
MKAEANIGGLLGKSSRMMSNALDAKLRPLGLTSQQWSLLAVLSTTGGRNQTELAKALLKTKASVGSLVNYLETKTYILREVSATDRRETIVVLTAA